MKIFNRLHLWWQGIQPVMDPAWFHSGVQRTILSLVMPVFQVIFGILVLFASFFPNQIEFNIEWKIHQEFRQNVLLERILALKYQCWTSVHPSWRVLRGGTPCTLHWIHHCIQFSEIWCIPSSNKILVQVHVLGIQCEQRIYRSYNHF